MDITYVMNSHATNKFLEHTEMELFQNKYIKLDGDFMIVTLSLEENDSSIFAENVQNEDGELKDHETDILVLSSTLPIELYTHFSEKTGYETLVKVN